MKNFIFLTLLVFIAMCQCEVWAEDRCEAKKDRCEAMKSSEHPVNEFMQSWLVSVKKLIARLERKEVWKDPVNLPLDKIMDLGKRLLRQVYGSKDTNANVGNALQHARGAICDCPSVYHGGLW